MIDRSVLLKVKVFAFVSVSHELNSNGQIREAGLTSYYYLLPLCTVQNMKKAFLCFLVALYLCGCHGRCPPWGVNWLIIGILQFSFAVMGYMVRT